MRILERFGHGIVPDAKSALRTRAFVRGSGSRGSVSCATVAHALLVVKVVLCVTATNTKTVMVYSPYTTYPRTYVLPIRQPCAVRHLQLSTPHLRPKRLRKRSCNLF